MRYTVIAICTCSAQPTKCDKIMVGFVWRYTILYYMISGLNSYTRLYYIISGLNSYTRLYYIISGLNRYTRLYYIISGLNRYTRLYYIRAQQIHEIILYYIRAQQLHEIILHRVPTGWGNSRTFPWLSAIFPWPYIIATDNLRQPKLCIFVIISHLYHEIHSYHEIFIRESFIKECNVVSWNRYACGPIDSK